MLSVAVIGAGAAGLAAAWRLASHGVGVVLYEKRPVVGGLMRSDEVSGVMVDPGVQLVSSTYRGLHRVIGEVGATGLLVRSPGRDALWRDGSAHAIAYGSAARMATSSALGVGLKFRLATHYLPYLLTRCRGLDANDAAGTGGADLDVETIAAWGTRELGEDFVEHVVYPFLVAHHGGTPEQTSAAFYHAVARVGLDVRFEAVRGGVGRLAAAIATAIEGRGGVIRSSSEIEDVQVDSGEVRVVGGGEVRSHEAAVVALPSAVAARLSVAGPQLREWLAGVERAITLTLAVVTARRVRADWFGLAFPRTEPPGDRLAGVWVAANKAEGAVASDRGLLIVKPSPLHASRLAASPETAPSFLLPAVEEAMPGATADIVAVKAYRHLEGHTQFFAGYLKHLLRYDPDWLPARVALAGDYLMAPTVEGAVLSGERAAERLLRMTGGSPAIPE
jgi:oxygen-dependent protoporphyrinogen oxidase